MVQPITLAVTDDGNLYWNDQPITKDQLESRLSIEAQKTPQPQINVRGDKTTKYRVVSEVVQIAAEPGHAQGRLRGRERTALSNRRTEPWHFSSGGGSGPMADINVTPLVDVMLVLLIIFMVTAPTLSYPIDIDLPQKSLNPPPQTHRAAGADQAAHRRRGPGVLERGAAAGVGAAEPDGSRGQPRSEEPAAARNRHQPGRRLRRAGQGPRRARRTPA